MRSILDRFRRPARPVLLPSSKPEVLPIKDEWVDDDVLRRLVQDHRDGKTHWVIASDLSEFYSKLDRIISDPPFVVEMHSNIARMVSDALDKDIHLKSYRPHDYFAQVGPPDMDSFRLRKGNNVLPMRYVYNIVESWFDFMPEGKPPIRYQCGMDLAEALNNKETALSFVVPRLNAT